MLKIFKKEWKFAPQHLKMKSDHMKERYDLNACGKFLQEGDVVWLYIQPKEKKRTVTNTYLLLERNLFYKELVYWIQRGPKTKPKVVHRNQLWKEKYGSRRLMTKNNRRPVRKQMLGKRRSQCNCHPPKQLGYSAQS